MRALFSEVCELQKLWVADNTPAMERRGVIVRQELPEWIRGHLPSLSSDMGATGDDLFVEGRDGTGRKTEIPWFRIASQSRSPSARVGWYLVVLFEALGNGCYLALAHGSTDFVDGSFKPKPEYDIREFMEWARGILASELTPHPELQSAIALNAQRSHLGAAYENTCVAAKFYPVDGLPDDSQFLSDLRMFAGFLRQIYLADDLGRAPDDSAPEIDDVEKAISPVRLPSPGRGQGRGLTTEERLVVEAHAMTIAQRTLEQRGFTVKDTSKNHPYDYVARRGEVEAIVEVKGTTSNGVKVLLTANEVAAHRAHFPQNMLIVVYSIDLDREATKPVASGGKVYASYPWEIDDDILSPIAFSYDVLEHQRRKLGE